MSDRNEMAPELSGARPRGFTGEEPGPTLAHLVEQVKLAIIEDEDYVWASRISGAGLAGREVESQRSYDLANTFKDRPGDQVIEVMENLVGWASEDERSNRDRARTARVMGKLGLRKAQVVKAAAVSFMAEVLARVDDGEMQRRELGKLWDPLLTAGTSDSRWLRVADQVEVVVAAVNTISRIAYGPESRISEPHKWQFTANLHVLARESKDQRVMELVQQKFRLRLEQLPLQLSSGEISGAEIPTLIGEVEELLWLSDSGGERHNLSYRFQTEVRDREAILLGVQLLGGYLQQLGSESFVYPEDWYGRNRVKESRSRVMGMLEFLFMRYGDEQVRQLAGGYLGLPGYENVNVEGERDE